MRRCHPSRQHRRPPCAITLHLTSFPPTTHGRTRRRRRPTPPSGRCGRSTTLSRSARPRQSLANRAVLSLGMVSSCTRIQPISTSTHRPVRPDRRSRRTCRFNACTPLASFPGSGANSVMPLVSRLLTIVRSAAHACLSPLPDIGSYSITQDIVVRTPCQGAGLEMSQTHTERLVSSVTYQFNTPHVSPPASPTSSNGDTYSYTTESSVSRQFYSIYAHILRKPPQLDRVNDFDGLLDASMSRTAASSSRSQQYCRYAAPSSSQASFDMTPPGLIRDGEEGYASQPQSPLDAVFPGGVGLEAALSAGADPLSGMCKSYGDVDFTGSAACQFDNVGVPSSFTSTGTYVPRLSDSLAHPGHQPYVSVPLVPGWAFIG
jgi:hypothetical protein